MSLTEATELLARLNAGETTSLELTQECLKRIERLDGSIGAFLDVDADGALRRAEEIDCQRKSGKRLGRLAGLPVAVKGLLAETGRPTSCASKMLENFRPPYDATSVAKLKAADAVIVGKTNMDEFAMGGSNENSAFGPVHNPWDLDRVPGGSSGGAAACVAAGMTPLSVGSDTGGSIRTPAGLCGVTGLKPTYGRISRYGLVAFASSLDQIGPLAPSVRDVALLLEVMAGYDKLDSTSVDRPVPDYSAALDRPLDGLRLGVISEHFGEGLDAEVSTAVREAIKVYESLGADVREISMPHGKYSVATYYIIAPCEASGNLARYDGVHYGRRADEEKIVAELEAERRELKAAGRADEAESLESPLLRMYRRSRSEGFGPEVKRRVMLGTYALSAGYYDAYYLKALKVRRLIRQDYDRAFDEVDLIAGPVTPTPAFAIGEKVDDPLAMYLFDLYTVSANLAGVPAISVPCGFSSTGLPIGLQLQAPTFAEERLLRGAQMFQNETDWHCREAECGK